MDKEVKFLYDWAIHFFKNRDLFYKKIKEIKDNQFGFMIISKDKVQQVVLIPHLEDYEGIKASIKEENKVIITFNSDKNFQVLVKGWNHFASQRFLAVYFINPRSIIEKKWVIFPYNHDRIADRDTLSKGLNSIFESVDPLTDSQVARLSKESIYG